MSSAKNKTFSIDMTGFFLVCEFVNNVFRAMNEELFLFGVIILANNDRESKD